MYEYVALSIRMTITNGAEEVQEGLTCVRGVTPTDIISTECVL